MTNFIPFNCIFSFMIVFSLSFHGLISLGCTHTLALGHTQMESCRPEPVKQNPLYDDDDYHY